MADRGQEQAQVRAEKLLRLRQMGIDPYPPRFHRTHTAAEAVAAAPPTGQTPESAQGPTGEVFVAGRITAMRVMGSAAFLDLRDGTGRIQVHLRRDVLGEGYGLVRELDLGDFLGVEGDLFRTRTGEPTVAAKSLAFLGKALRPPPDKRHGLRDVEQRFRQREADLMASQEVRDRFVLRSRVIGAVRQFLVRRGFVEVETPVLVPVAAGALARPFVTRHNALGRTLYLRIATELYLKRCVVGGLERVFEIGRVFRNEGLDARHNPEFTTLESYQAYADYLETMEMTEAMVAEVTREVTGGATLAWGDATVDLAPPWRRITLRQALLERSGVDIEACADAPSLASRMRGLGIAVTQEASWGRLVDKLLSETVEPGLVQPTFLLDYPVEMSPLAKQKPDDPRYVERFEAFVGGMEIANAFSELNDPQEQRRRLLVQEEMRRLHGDEELDRLDEEFLEALEYGMPPTGGLGVGIDRLVMLLSNQPNIREVLLFPHLSWSQAEVFREVDRMLRELVEAGEGSAPENLARRVSEALPSELGGRITLAELESRAAAIVGLRGLGGRDAEH